MDEMLFLLRGLILDIVTPYKYSDILLNRVLLVGTMQVSQALSLDYIINVQAGTVVPDITGDQTTQNLIVLKSACLIQADAATKASEKGMLVKDAIATVDTRNYANDLINLLKSGKSYCDMYDNAEMDYKLYGPTGGGYGAAIMGPIREYYNANYVRSA